MADFCETGRENKFCFSVCAVTFEGARHKPLCGVLFELEGRGVYAAISDTYGKAAFCVPAGNYKLYEKAAPENYIVDGTVYNVSVLPDGMALIEGKPADTFPPIRVTYDRASCTPFPKGVLAFIKTDDSGCLLPGCSFVLMNRKTCDIMKTKSDGRGRVTFRNIKRGIYTLTETCVPEGYCLSPVTHTVTCDRNGNIKLDGVSAAKVAGMCFENHTLPGPGELGFYAANDMGDYLEGSIFVLRRNGANMYESVSGEDGMVSFSGLDEGEYLLEQVTAPDNYNTSEITFNVSVAVDKTVMVGGRPARDFMNYIFINPAAEGYKASFSIMVINDQGEGLCGAQFMLYDQYMAPAVKAVTGVKGEAVFKNITYGSYILRETCPPDGYLAFTAMLPVIVAWDGSVYIAGQPAEYYPPIISSRKNRKKS